MAITAKRRTIGENSSFGPRDETASLIWDVDGTDNSLLARTAPGIPQRLQRHPSNYKLVADVISPSAVGPKSWSVRVDYITPAGTEFGFDEAQDVDPTLDDPPEVEFQIGNKSVMIDRDIHGNPLVTSCYTPYDPHQTRDITTMFATYRRTESTFNVKQALEYSNSVNTDRFNFLGFNTFEPGEVKCISIQPAGVIRKADERLRMEYTFEFSELIDLGSGQKDGAYNLRVKDEGVYTTTGTGGNPVLVKDDEGNQMIEPVLLNGKGGEFGTSDGAGTPAGALVDMEQEAAYLVWENYKKKPFGILRIE